MEKDREIQSEDDLEQVAVIGMAGAFPGASSIQKFWENIRGGVESVVRFTDEELKAKGAPSEWLRNPNFVKAGTYLEHSSEFDSEFFGYSPREALLMDPQQRMFLEKAWEALENAGYNPETYEGPIGVFAGTSASSYSSLFPGTPHDDAAGRMELMIGNRPDYVATRVSYKLNLKGPSLAVQTACSTSLTAVQLGIQSLLSYQCDMALAGGASVSAEPCWGYFYQEGHILSPDGHCRAFDAKAGGTVVGQGVGVVLLKRLSDALADHDSIYAVIRGCAINNDGSGKIGYTAPSVKGQAEVIALAHVLSGVTAESITYLEAHGTGTKLGDPIEVAALSEAFRAGTAQKSFCAIGSVKINIGHADAAAGIAGLIKIVLMLQNKEIPPSLNYETPNPEIDFANSPFYVATRLTEWKSEKFPRRAGVSSLGIGGTNVHAVLEEAPAPHRPEPSRPWQLILLSAKTPSALEAASENLARHLKENPDICLPDAAYTLKIGRKHFRHRKMIVCRSSEEAASLLTLSGPRQALNTRIESEVPRLTFMFTGQGSQYVNMGKGLYLSEPVFKQEVDKCAGMLEPILSKDLRNVLYPAGRATGDNVELLDQTALAQPALFTVEYALAKLWEEWGIRPASMVGHSIGEYVAACLAGVFDLPSALEIVAARGRLMQEMQTGAMLVVAVSERGVHRFLCEDLALAAVNAPALCVISGGFSAIEKLERQLEHEKIDHKRLVTSHAFHSQMMDVAVKRFMGELSRHELRPPKAPFLSNVSGTWITPDQATNPRYWAEHLRRTVRFSDCLETLLRNENQVLLEVGPGNTLCTLAKQQVNRPKGIGIMSSVRHPNENHSDDEHLLSALGRLWLHGLEPDWAGFYRDEKRSRIPLPTYPFERKHYQPQPAARQSLDTAALGIPLPRPIAPIMVSAQRDLAAPVSPPLSTGRKAKARTEIERSMAEIWQRVLGVDQIGTHEDYFELGGSSLLAVRLFSEIERIFGKKLPLATLLEAPTIERLSRFIEAETGEMFWGSLVPIRREGSRPPLFLVHAAGGNLIIYKDLVRHLGPEQPVYGLQSQGLDGSKPFLGRIEDMAAAYLEELQAAQPEGPYFLGGYCMGGTIALEMAQQLHNRGQRVSLLAMLETYNWSRIGKRPLVDDLFFYFQKIEFHFRNLLISNDFKTFFKEKMRVLRARKNVWRQMLRSKLSWQPGLADSDNNRLYELWHSNDKAAFDYIASSYAGRVTFFRAVRQYALFDRPGAGWGDLAKEGVDIRLLPVYPAGMLLEPFVRILAKELHAYIEEAIGNESGLCTVVKN